MYNFGANLLSSIPHRFVSDDVAVVYRKNTHGLASFYEADDYIQVAAIRPNRFAIWCFMIFFTDSQVKIEIENYRGWQAFSDFPELFSALAEFSNNFDVRTEDIIDRLKLLGVVEHLD